MNTTTFFKHCIARSPMGSQGQQLAAHDVPSHAQNLSYRHSPVVAVWHKNPLSGKLECLWAAVPVCDDDREPSLCAGFHRAA